ncbi:MAG: fumarate reductase/succinate dehydrogenase flavoprotein subunit, partial [Acidobacteriota bacterium]|nr:fumarate reductase/succinate dehydrogenase flavoprotein subunit [Acidobacteriota bacterium]
AQIEQAARRAFAPFDRGAGGGAAEGPFAIQRQLQVMMQELVGIVRTQAEMERALAGIARLREQAERVAVSGNREYNPGWHTALDLPNLLTVSQAVTLAALERQESRGAQFREDFPAKDAELGKVNIVVRKGSDGEMRIVRAPLPAPAPELQRIIEEMK